MKLSTRRPRRQSDLLSCTRSPLRPEPVLAGFGARGTDQRGYVMVLSMMILLLITIMSISMAKSFFLEEGMAGNMREKNRSFLAAQTALAYGETYAMQLGSPGTAACAVGTATASIQIALQVCSNAPNVIAAPNGNPNGGTMPLQSYFPIPTTYLNMTVNNAGGKDTYFAAPGVYIQYLGAVAASNGANMYQVTAFGYGGSQNSVSVVQSTFLAITATGCLKVGNCG